VNDVMRRASAQHEAAFNEVLTELDAEFGDSLLSIVLCGSLARDTGGPGSDIDLVVLTSQRWSEIRQVRRIGVDIDLFIHWRDYVESRLLAGGLYPVLHMLSTGMILIDKLETTSQLIDPARKTLDQPRRAATSQDLATKRLVILGYMRTVKTYTAAMSAETALIMARLINYCIEYSNEAHCQWDLPHKYRLSGVRERDPLMHALMVRALDGTTRIEDRVQAAEALVCTVLGETTANEDTIGPRTIHCN
jgi:predicted nucleotidyltransferase